MVGYYNNGYSYTQNPYQGQMQQVQMNQNVLIRVQCENDARMYPVAPGTSVLFMDENASYIYAKTVNMSQLDRPIFEKYRLIKEDSQPAEPPQQADMSKFVTHDELQKFREELNDLMKKGA